MSYLKQFSNATHFIGAGILAVLAFVATPAGQALITQYPKLSVFVTLLGMIAALYKNPTKGAKNEKSQ